MEVIVSKFRAAGTADSQTGYSRPSGTMRSDSQACAAHLDRAICCDGNFFLTEDKGGLSSSSSSLPA